MAMTRRLEQEQERRYAAHQAALRADEDQGEELSDESNLVTTCAFAGSCANLDVPWCVCTSPVAP